MSKEDDLARAKSQARAQLECIVEMVEAVRAADEADGDVETAQDRIYNDPLSVEVRSGWHTPGEKSEPEEFRILLCTGGPAVQIIGDLGTWNSPQSPRIQYQDWFTPWVDLDDISTDEQAALQAYCEQHYFGE